MPRLKMSASGRLDLKLPTLLLAHPTGLAVEEPWYLISNAEPALDLV